MADGVLYTQGAAPGVKVPLGNIRQDIKYFDYVSAVDHACRYYIPHAPRGEDAQPSWGTSLVEANVGTDKA